MDITSIDQLDPNATYSYADYLQWQIDERIELIKGKIFRMSPAPPTRHQLYVGEIYRRLSNHLYRNSCKVFISPFDVRLTPLRKTDSSKIYTVVQPAIYAWFVILTKSIKKVALGHLILLLKCYHLVTRIKK